MALPKPAEMQAQHHDDRQPPAGRPGGPIDVQRATGGVRDALRVQYCGSGGVEPESGGQRRPCRPPRTNGRSNPHPRGQRAAAPA